MATLYILYGSATGNAEYIAKDLAAKGPPAPFKSVVCEALEKFKKHADSVWVNPPTEGTGMRKHGLLVICSTTGNGDPPENASRFARYVKRKTTIEAKAFQHVSYAVLGLGDTNYDIFCGAAKSIDKKLEECGGERIKPLACADEATGLEEGVEPWTESILAEITKKCFQPSGDKKDNAQEETKSDAAAQPVVSATPKEEENKPVEVASPKSKPAPSKPKTLDKTVKSESPLFILYGSATGNAEQIAKDLAATYNMFLSNPDAVTYFPSVVCCDLNGWRKQCLPIWEKAPTNGGKHGVLIVTSTTGNADPPENADRFVRWIKRKQTIAALPLQHSAYSVLGLGDTNYDVFCAIGKAVDKQLETLGGTRAKPVACADEATGLEEVVDPWVASILLEISLACQPDTSTATNSSNNDENIPPQTVSSSSKPVDKSADIQEEKKMDSGDIATPPQSTVVAASSTGVRTVCSVLNLDCKCPLEEVDRRCLPKIGTSMSSCELLSQLEEEQILQAVASADDDRVTVSSASSSAIHYTLQKPFESTIRSARYLTTTSTDAAKQATDVLGNGGESAIKQATDVYTGHFPLTVSESVTAETVERNGKRVIELTLTLPDDFTLEYTPGDSLGLIVENPPAAVDFVLGMLQESQGILPDQRVSIDNGNPVTVREAISGEVDLSSPLKSKRILSNLSQHATDCEDRKALQLLASKTPAGEKAFESFVDQQRLSVVDILQEFPSCQGIPLTALLGILPGIPPRYYSVSSSPLAPQQELSLTVSFSVVDYVTPSLLSVDQEERGFRRKKGIATSYLEVLASPFLAGGVADSTAMPTVKIFPKPTADFRMPSSLATPMVLIGPGTGIAPFMGFLQHRRAMLSSMESKEAASSVVEGTWRGGYEMEEEDLKISKGDASGLSVGADFVSKNLEDNVGSVDVFFGCRHEDHDWLYRDDMKELVANGTIAQLHTAFSRDHAATTVSSNNGQRRKYVQDLMLEKDCTARLKSLILEKNASIFVCGDGNAMAKDVQAALTQIVGQGLGSDDEKEAKLYVDKMKNDKRYLVDIWTS